MARPIFPYELGDEDFSWLISNFVENNPHYKAVEDTCLPVVFVPAEGPDFIPDDVPPVHEVHDPNELLDHLPEDTDL